MPSPGGGGVCTACAAHGVVCSNLRRETGFKSRLAEERTRISILSAGLKNDDGRVDVLREGQEVGGRVDEKVQRDPPVEGAGASPLEAGGMADLCERHILLLRQLRERGGAFSVARMKFLR